MALHLPSRFLRLFLPEAPCAPTIPQEAALASGQFVRVRQPLGRRVHCERGCLWLTFNGDRRDVILEAGQAHRCERDTPLIVQALADACLRIE